MQAWEAVLETASGKGYIKDREPENIPDLEGYGKKLLDAMKEALPEKMEAAGPQQLTFPIIRSLFVFAFIKGFEAGCRLDDPSPGDVELKDMLTGSVKVDLTREMADYVNSRPIPDDLFFAFQDWAFINQKQLDSGKMDLEEELFMALERVFRVGVSVAMEFEG